MGSCPVFKWVRAVLNPHYLSLLPESLDRISLLTEVAASLKLTADVSSDLDSPALQGEWEDIIQAQMKLLGLISESQISADKNGKETDQYEIPISLEEKPTNETVGNSEISDVEVGTTVEFEVRENGDVINESGNIQEARTIFAKNWKSADPAEFPIEIKNGGSEVRNVFVIADDLDQLDLLSQNTGNRAIAHAQVNNQDEPITTYVDGTQQQLIFVTGSLLESDDKTSEDVCLKVEDELYMDIVLAPREDNRKATGDDRSTETTNSKDKDNPLNKLCQLLRIDEEEVIDKRCDELERKRKYENNLPYKYFCTQCSYRSKRENHFQKHLKLHEKHQALYCCSKCQYRTIRASTLRRHELQHNADRVANCKLCSYKTDSSKLLARHIRTRHTGNRRVLRCAECGFKTGSQRDLNNHKRSHDPVKPKEYWDCDQCAYRTQVKGHLARHKNDIHGEARPFLCHHCGKSFKRHDTLKQHKIVHGELTQTYVCTECNKICRTSAQLKEHMMVHSTQRPILCELCGATFKTRSVHYRHVKKLHSDVSFQCKICKLSFSNKPALMKHAKTHRSGGDLLDIKKEVNS